jgi:transposase
MINAYRERRRIEATFNQFKDFRRIAPRYDKLAAVIAFWCRLSLNPSTSHSRSA